MTPEDRKEMRSCRGKQRYPTMECAEQKVKELWERKFHLGLTPYACDFCGTFHVGHKTESALTYKFIKTVEYLLLIASHALPAIKDIEDRHFAYVALKASLASVFAGRAAKAAKLIDHHRTKAMLKEMGLVKQQAWQRLNEIYVGTPTAPHLEHRDTGVKLLYALCHAETHEERDRLAKELDAHLSGTPTAPATLEEGK